VGRTHSIGRVGLRLRVVVEVLPKCLLAGSCLTWICNGEDAINSRKAPAKHFSFLRFQSSEIECDLIRVELSATRPRETAAIPRTLGGGRFLGELHQFLTDSLLNGFIKASSVSLKNLQHNLLSDVPLRGSKKQLLQHYPLGPSYLTTVFSETVLNSRHPLCDPRRHQTWRDAEVPDTSVLLICTPLRCGPAYPESA
jgi:hypothetical protein